MVLKKYKTRFLLLLVLVFAQITASPQDTLVVSNGQGVPFSNTARDAIQESCLRSAPGVVRVISLDEVRYRGDSSRYRITARMRESRAAIDGGSPSAVWRTLSLVDSLRNRSPADTTGGYQFLVVDSIVCHSCTVDGATIDVERDTSVSGPEACAVIALLRRNQFDFRESHMYSANDFHKDILKYNFVSVHKMSVGYYEVHFYGEYRMRRADDYRFAGEGIYCIRVGDMLMITHLLPKMHYDPVW